MQPSFETEFTGTGWPSCELPKTPKQVLFTIGDRVYRGQVVIKLVLNTDSPAEIQYEFSGSMLPKIKVRKNGVMHRQRFPAKGIRPYAEFRNVT